MPFARLLEKIGKKSFQFILPYSSDLLLVSLTLYSCWQLRMCRFPQPWTGWRPGIQEVWCFPTLPSGCLPSVSASFSPPELSSCCLSGPLTNTYGYILSELQTRAINSRVMCQGVYLGGWNKPGAGGEVRLTEVVCLLSREARVEVLSRLWMML